MSVRIALSLTGLFVKRIIILVDVFWSSHVLSPNLKTRKSFARPVASTMVSLHKFFEIATTKCLRSRLVALVLLTKLEVSI